MEVTAGAGSVISAAVFRVAGYGADVAVESIPLVARFGSYVAAGAAVGAPADVGNQFLSNVTSRYIMNQDTTGLGDNLGIAAYMGAGFGALGGIMQAGGEGFIASRSIGRVLPAEHPVIEGLSEVELRALVPVRHDWILPADNPNGVGMDRLTPVTRRLRALDAARVRLRQFRITGLLGMTSVAPDAYASWKKESKIAA
jgi:hypothetical protein